MRAYPSTPLCRKVETREHAGMLLTSLTFPVGGNRISNVKLIGSFPLDDDNVAEPGHAGSGSAFEEQLMSLITVDQSLLVMK
jgi:hypothetical protein